MEWISANGLKPRVKCLATYVNSHGMRRLIAAEYIPKFFEVADSDSENTDYHEETDEYYLAEGWYEQQDNWGDYASIAVNEGEVTHWMHRPAWPQNDIPQ